MNPSHLKDRAEFLKTVNNELRKMNNDDIWILNAYPSTKKFNVKNQCLNRDYLYILPMVQLLRLD